MTTWINNMREWIHTSKEWMASLATGEYAMASLFILSFAESSFFPLPPDILLIAMCFVDKKQALLYALVCTAGSVLGGMFGFGIGKVGGRPVLDRLFKQEKIKYVENQYQEYDIWAVAVAGFTPIPYKVFTISAGVFKLNFVRFILASLFSRGARFFIIGGLFYLCPDEKLDWLKAMIAKYDIWIGIITIVGVILGFVFLGKHAHKHAKRAAEAENNSENPDIDCNCGECESCK